MEIFFIRFFRANNAVAIYSLANVDDGDEHHWQVRLPEVVSAVLADPDKFRDLYRFTYRVNLIMIAMMM